MIAIRVNYDCYILIENMFHLDEKIETWLLTYLRLKLNQIEQFNSHYNYKTI